MILAFRVEDKPEFDKALETFMRNYERKLPPALKVHFLRKIRYKVVNYKSLPGHLLVVFNWPMLLDLMPGFFYHWALKKGLRKQGYTGEYRKVKLSAALEMISF